ncbi:hypothetical protein [Chamaesiphon sp. OTE_20_metabat_361]|uniref:hypothetical protein n=1 Tax=Chamaesiphon sp. OTE_20_metabat_361 TaxID=2964689 RepID=UPI00286AF3F5|nr:hypothetical protein [Chamaesiphon sp. OTE_20_metabat_361]
MQIFPYAEPILVPLVPTIAGAIADYLQLLAQQVCVTSPHNYDDLATDSALDRSWHWQYKSSIRLVTTSQYQYVSTIAHRLAAKSAFNFQEICQNFVEMGDGGTGSIASVTIQTSSELLLDGWYNEAGYIYFRVTAESIGKWLSYIHDLPLNLDLNSQLDDTATSMAVYAHARCCSILKLAASEQLISLTDDWQLVEPIFSHQQSISSDWICGENPLEAATSRLFEHPMEQRLIQVLMRILDSIYERDGMQHDRDRCNFTANVQQSIWQQSPNWAKLTLTLAQSWLDFYRDCRIFGDLKHQNPRLAIARCGLSAIVRRYLQLLLTNYLSIHARIEL